MTILDRKRLKCLYDLPLEIFKISDIDLNFITLIYILIN